VVAFGAKSERVALSNGPHEFKGQSVVPNDVDIIDTDKNQAL